MSSCRCSRVVQSAIKDSVWVVDREQSVAVKYHSHQSGSVQGGRIHRLDVVKAIRNCWNARKSLGLWAPV